MGKPRFKPADVVVNPRHFGRYAYPTWNDDHGLSQKERAWAIYQHRAALAVTKFLERNEHSIGWLAQKLGEDTAWLTRKLHGQAPADLGDIMSWALELGIEVLPTFGFKHEIAPT